MVVARWPNIDLDDPNTPDGWQWTHARVGDDDAIHYGNSGVPGGTFSSHTLRFSTQLTR